MPYAPARASIQIEVTITQQVCNQIGSFSIADADIKRVARNNYEATLRFSLEKYHHDREGRSITVTIEIK